MLLFIFIIGCMVTIISFCSFILLIYQLYCNSTNKNIKKQWYKIPPILSSTFYLLSCIFYLIFAWHLSSTSSSTDHNLSLILISSALATCILFAKLFIYITFLARLYFTFCDSCQAVSTKLIKFITILLIIFFLCVIWWNILLIQRYILKLDVNNILYKPQFIIVFCSLVFCDITSYVIMLYLFLSKLFLLITNRRRTIIWRSVDKIHRSMRALSTVSSNTENGTSFNWKFSRSLPTTSPSGLALKEYTSNTGYYGNDSIAKTDNFPSTNFSYSKSRILEYLKYKENAKMSTETLTNKNTISNAKSENDKRKIYHKKEASLVSNNLDDKDMTILDAMTRYTILNVFTMITSQLGYLSFFILGLIQFLFDVNENKTHIVFEHYSMYIVVAGLYPLDVITNCVVIYTSFKFGKFVYYKLCGKVHDYCQIKYALRIEKNLKTFEQPEIVSPTKNPSYFVLDEDVNKSLQTDKL
eukprot:491248_1